MPTYEYACSACGHEWEEEQRIVEPALDTCPACNQKTARRLISGTANFILKGGGWYADLYSKPAGKKDNDNSPKGSATSTTSAKETKETSAKEPSTSKPNPAPSSPSTAPPST